LLSALPPRGGDSNRYQFLAPKKKRKEKKRKKGGFVSVASRRRPLFAQTTITTYRLKNRRLDSLLSLFSLSQNQRLVVNFLETRERTKHKKEKKGDNDRATKKQHSLRLESRGCV